MNTNGLEIAIIGMAGRFPGARNIDEYWQNIQNGTESIRPLTDEYLLSQGVDKESLKHPQYVKAGAVLEDVELFDADFFGFSPREAEILDPQQRLFLECAVEAIETAGYNPQTYPGLIGVYGGAGMNGYLFNLYTNPNIRNSVSNYQLFLASDKDFLTTRVSYKLNLSGPSVDVQTACSTSLVAVHIACQSLLSGECDMALAGGVAIAKQLGYLYQEGGIYSPDGHCRAFDANAKGTVSGSGVGIVVLKRLEDALNDGDSIDAVIKGSAINNDGAFKVSYTSPSIDAQAKVIRAAQLIAEVEPESISYIEAHGTGTALGDPIEIAALTQVFGSEKRVEGVEGVEKKQKPCGIGSVKTNIGHLDTAAGIASLIKAVLALKYKQIPPSLHFEQPNPQIDFKNSPFYVNASLSAWETDKLPRRAGVSCFGIGGTNAHVVLEENLTPSLRTPLSLLRRGEGDGTETPLSFTSTGERNVSDGTPLSFTRRGDGGEVNDSWELLLISAKTESALEKATANLATYLETNPDLNLADVAYTLKVGREEFEHRRFLVSQNIESAIELLKSPSAPEVFTDTHTPTTRSIAFMFSGQGSQYVNMGRELYETQTVFRETVDNCCTLLKPHLGFDLRTLIYPNKGTGNREQGIGNRNSSPSLNQTAQAQPAIFIIEYALAKLWMSWGIIPQVTIGHSIGEYVAATIAGVFFLEDALKVVANRGKLMQQQPTGSMLSVFLSAKDIQCWLSEEVTLAVVNSPNLCVVSGSKEAIANLQQSLESSNIACRLLHTSHAFHSPMMSGAEKPFMEVLESIKLNPPAIPFISNVTGTWITAKEATDKAYWVKHLRETVQFAAGIEELTSYSSRILLEVGAGRALSTFAKGQGELVLTSLRHPKEDKSDVDFILNTLGQLWLNGLTINWTGFYQQQKRYRIPLPTYPFERKRYWIDASSSISQDLRGKNKVKINHDGDWFYIPSWERDKVEFVTAEKLTSKKYVWLIFVDSAGIGSEISQQLGNAGHDVITVAVGDKFDQLGYRQFCINPENRKDYVELLEDLELRELSVERVIHLWNLDDVSTNFADAQKLGFYSLLYLTQAISQQKINNSIYIKIITNCLYDIVGEEDLHSIQSPIVGLGKVISQEYPNITCCNIDVTLDEKGKERLVKQLLSEAISQPTDFTVAYRARYRWKQQFRLVKRNDESNNNIQLRSEGIYLIIGDLVNGLGRVFAEYLVKTLGAKLVLIGDEKPSWEWEEYLFVEADITNELQVENAISQAESHFGGINGVFYSTPMSNENSTATIGELTRNHCEYNFRYKVYGLQVLEKVLQSRKVDFCILQSSLSTVVGGLGLGAYSAANYFVDAFAQQQLTNNLNSNTNSTPWFSVNWDACDFELNQHREFSSNMAEFALTPDEVWKATQNILDMAAFPQVVVSKGELDARIKQWINVKPLNETSTISNNSSHTRPNLTNEYIAPRNDIEQAIAQIWQDLLGIDKVGVNDSFFELGGHSLLAVQAIARLREMFQVELEMRSVLFEAPTVGKIAELVEKEQPKEDDLAQMADVLAEIQGLSAEEIAKELGG